MIRRSGRHSLLFEKLIVVRACEWPGSKHEISKDARHREQSERSRHRREVWITQSEQQRSKGQKDSEPPPNAHAKSRADQKDSADQNQKHADCEKNEGEHGAVLSRASARRRTMNALPDDSFAQRRVLSGQQFLSQLVTAFVRVLPRAGKGVVDLC